MAIKFVSQSLNTSPASSTMLQLIRNGFSPHRDPFIFMALHYLRSWVWYDGIRRFRIPCPRGANCFGIFDESRTLKYDNGKGYPQVFIQVRALITDFDYNRSLVAGIQHRVLFILYSNTAASYYNETDFQTRCSIHH